MFKKKYRVECIIFDKGKEISGHCHMDIGFYSFLVNKTTDDIEKIIEDAIVQKYNVKADDFSICIQNIIPYNLRDWK